MEITRSYFKNFILIATGILASISAVFSSFAFSDYGTGMIDYYCLSQNSFFGFEFWEYTNCPVYTVIGYITFITIIFLLSLLVIAFILDFFRSLFLQANVKVLKLEKQDYDIEEKYDESARKKILYNYGSLRIINREHEELTECYAEVKNVYTFDPIFGLLNLTSFFFHGVGSKRIGWKGNNDNCFETIGARTGEKILRVYRLGLDEDSNKVVSDFNICDKSHKAGAFGNNELIAELEIYVKSKSIGQKSIKAFYLIQWVYEKNEKGASYGVELWKINILYYRILSQIRKIQFKRELKTKNHNKKQPKTKNP